MNVAAIVMMKIKWYLENFEAYARRFEKMKVS